MKISQQVKKMVENWRNDYLRALPAVDAVVAAFQSAYSRL